MDTPLVVALDLEWEDLGPEEAALAGVGAQLVRLADLEDSQLERVVGLLTEGIAGVRADDLRRYPNLKVVSELSTGYDAVDVETARQLGIAVTHVAGYCTDEVADHTLALALHLIRHLDSLSRQALQGQWLNVDAGSIRRSRDSIWGVVGFGRIGRAVARRASAFGFAICAHDPDLTDEQIAELGARPATLDELLELSDVVSLHAARTGRDDHMLDRRRLARLKPTAYLINVARGAFIDEDALADALDTRRLAGAALDVLTDEPPDPSNRLLGHPRTLVTPHSAWYSDSALTELRARGVGAVVDVLSGRRPADLVPELAGARS
ncbi:MAG TPA: C-terminal binding protein [Solirubrobacteraceae bacterium]|nr:C-terminal binding protein [Solirubrobacteraceae bacterium]